MALFMPWRSMELAHLQLLGAHWFPLIWLLVMRILVGEGGRRDGFALSLVLSLQLLSSYYVAYTLTFNRALFVVLVCLQVGLRRGPLLLLSLAFVVILARYSSSEIAIFTVASFYFFALEFFCVLTAVLFFFRRPLHRLKRPCRLR